MHITKYAYGSEFNFFIHGIYDEKSLEATALACLANSGFPFSILYTSQFLLCKNHLLENLSSITFDSALLPLCINFIVSRPQF